MKYWTLLSWYWEWDEQSPHHQFLSTSKRIPPEQKCKNKREESSYLEMKKWKGHDLHMTWLHIQMIQRIYKLCICIAKFFRQLIVQKLILFLHIGNHLKMKWRRCHVLQHQNVQISRNKAFKRCTSPLQHALHNDNEGN